MTSKTSSIPTVIHSLKGHALVWTLVFISSCSSLGGPTPKWDGKLWPGDSAHGRVVRKNDPPTPDEEILATDPKFDEGVWISYADLRSFYKTYVLGCKTWKKNAQMMNTQEAYRVWKPVVDDYYKRRSMGALEAPSVEDVKELESEDQEEQN